MRKIEPMTREEEQIFLRNIEIPECTCRYILDCDCAQRLGPGPCREPIHIADRCIHMLAMVRTNPWIRQTIDCEPTLQYERVRQWAALLRKNFPKEYAEPPPPPFPMLALKREARVTIMRRRREAGLGLHHPRDLRADHEAVDDLARETGMTLNWRATEEQLVPMTVRHKPAEETYRVAVSKMLEEWRATHPDKRAV